jgi:surfeit locus 1 family protein
MIRFKPLPLMSLLSIIALAVLISFGRWQWEKYERKPPPLKSRSRK